MKLTKEIAEFLNPDKLKYSEYIKLKDEYKKMFLFILEYSKDSELKYVKKDWFSNVSLSERKFGIVKQMQEALINNSINDFIEILIKNGEYNEKKILEEQAYKFLKTIDYLVEETINLINYEKELLISKVPNKNEGFIDQVDFSQFSSHFIQRDQLANGDITKYEEIDNLPYETCFIKLLYNLKNSDVEKMILNKSIK